MTAPIAGSAKIASDGKVTQLGSKATSDEVVTEKDVQEPDKLARMLARLLKDVAALRRRFAPRWIDFEDVPGGAGTSHPLQHNFNGRVRWWIVDWADSTRPNFFRDATATTNDTLVLTCNFAGTATIRVEEAG